MKKVRITVMRMARYDDLIEEYERPLRNPCDMKLNQVFVSDGLKMPKGFCESAWITISPYVTALSRGVEDFFGGWMKNKKSVMLSCNDGFRPVSFYIEALDEDSDADIFMSLDDDLESHIFLS